MLRHVSDTISILTSFALFAVCVLLFSFAPTMSMIVFTHYLIDIAPSEPTSPLTGISLMPLEFASVIVDQLPYGIWMNPDARRSLKMLQCFVSDLFSKNLFSFLLVGKFFLCKWQWLVNLVVMEILPYFMPNIIHRKRLDLICYEGSLSFRNLIFFIFIWGLLRHHWLRLHQYLIIIIKLLLSQCC